MEGRKEKFYLTTCSTYFLYGQIVRGSLLLSLGARDLLYAPPNKQDNTYHGHCYTSCGTLAGKKDIAQWVHHEELIPQSMTP